MEFLAETAPIILSCDLSTTLTKALWAQSGLGMWTIKHLNKYVYIGNALPVNI